MNDIVFASSMKNQMFLKVKNEKKSFAIQA